ncbi:MAG: CDP-alcohol phosphatidyltransferase family protein [Acidobacteria bacterium]|nr:CDP-alcohol phosphatidyltransferase family protein [Acidobacteriota bacterium]
MQILGQLFYLSNQLSLLRLVFIPFVILSILYGQYRTAFVLVLIAGLSDGMDGLLARRLGQQTTLGSILDPLADKLLLNSAFVALGVAQQLPLWLVILVLSRDVLIITISLVLILSTLHKPSPPSLYGKANTVAQVSTVLLTLFVLVLPNETLAGLQVVGIYTTAGLTVASGLQYASRIAERLRGVDQSAASARPHSMEERPMKEHEEETVTGRNRVQ